MRFTRFDGVKIGIRRQQAFGHGTVHACACGDVGQHASVADVTPLDPIGAHQGGDGKGLPPFQARPVDDAVGVQGVGDAFGGVGVHLDAVRLGDVTEPLVDGVKLGLGAEAFQQVCLSTPSGAMSGFSWNGCHSI